MFQVNKKTVLQLTLLVLLVLISAFAYMHYEVSEEMRYVTSEKCQECHSDEYNSWRENTLHPYMFLPVSSPDAKILGDFESGDPAVTFKKEDIEFVLGSKWEQVYARMIDGEYYPFPAKWYVMQNRWVPYKVDDWHETPMSYKCNGCHTTGFDPNTLEFAEFGIGCEACHGPGSRHVQHETTEHTKPCNICHESESSEDEGEEEGDIIRSVSASVCGQCHNRGSTASGEIIKGTQFNFPTGFTPGDDLSKTTFDPSTPKNDKKGKNWWGNGLSKNRHQEFSDWNKSKHSKALTKLLESHQHEESKRGPLTKECLQCHSTDYRHASEGEKPDLNSARFGVTCVSCHEPHGHDKKQPGFGDGATVCGNCHVMQMAQNEERHFPCPSEQVGCPSCHMPRMVKTGGFFSLRSHAFKVVKPESSKGNKMPNSCQNAGCHSDRTLDWAINAYDAFYGKVK